MQSDVVDLLPGVGLFTPDEDFAVVGGGSKDVAIFGVRPCYTPDGAFMSVQASIPAIGDVRG